MRGFPGLRRLEHGEPPVRSFVAGKRARKLAVFYIPRIVVAQAAGSARLSADRRPNLQKLLGRIALDVGRIGLTQDAEFAGLLIEGRKGPAPKVHTLELFGRLLARPGQPLIRKVFFGRLSELLGRDASLLQERLHPAKCSQPLSLRNRGQALRQFIGRLSLLGLGLRCVALRLPFGLGLTLQLLLTVALDL